MKSTHQLANLFKTTNHRPVGLRVGFLALLLSAVSLRADILASYNMENGDPVLRISPSFQDAGVTGTTIVKNNIGTIGVLTKGSAYTTWPTTLGGGTTAADAVTAAQYLSLTVSPNLGNTITLDSFSFDIFAATAGPSTRQIYVFSDKTGFVAGDELFSASTANGNPNVIPYNTAAAGQNFSIDLSAYGPLANVSDSVTFRIYFQTPNAAQGIALDNLTVSGTVTPVPEPATYAFLGLGLGGLWVTNRFRRRA